MDDLPAKLDDIVRFSCNINIDSLIKIIQFLHKNNSEMGMTIKDLTKRIETIEQLNDDLAQVTLKTQAHEKKFYEVEESLSHHSNKILEIDGKIAEFTKVNKSSFEKIEEHEENINNLNRVVEEHLKSTKAQDDKIATIEKNMIDTSLKFDKSISDIKNSKEIENKMKESISNLSMEINEVKDTFELKVIDIDKTVSNLISTLSQVSQDGEGNTNGGTNIIIKRTTSSTNMSTSASDYLVKLALDDIDKLTKKTEESSRNYIEIKKLIKNGNEANDQERNEINKRIDQLKETIKRIQSNNQEMQMNTNDNNGDDENAKDDHFFANRGSSQSEENQKNLYELYKQLSENISILGTSLGNKINRDELNNMNLVTMGKIELLSDKLSESLLVIDNKMKKLSSLGGGDGSSNQLSDFDFFTQSFEKQMIENINKISIENIKKLVIEGDISSNPGIARIISHINKHTNDLNEAYKSIVDIRSILVSNEILEDINDIKARLELSEEDYRRLKFKFDEFKSSLEEEDQPEPLAKQTPSPNQFPRQSTLINASINMKSSVSFLSAAYKDMSDKLQTLEKNHKEMTNEIRESIKNSLKSETERVIEQFQKNLNSFTKKFEYQLKNKIDQIGLSSFEYKINNRLSNEMKNKLDQKDMKKNNHVINRKLDSLENKISKTLVDTIIDLQMDEAPLMIKKNNRNVEKCASCNQSLPQTTYLLTNDNLAPSGVVNKMRTSKFNFSKDKDNNKDKLPDIE